MRLFRTASGAYVENDGQFFTCGNVDWDTFLNDDLIHGKLSNIISKEKPVSIDLHLFEPLKPIVSQELWACGVTYLKSKVGRQEESKDSGGADFYGKVYDAERPEVFFKATPNRVVGPGEDVRIRKDSTWDVPEPELTLVVSSSGKIIGYTIGNDMSSRSIEGENPLYLPQAKTYDKCAALGPCVYITEDALSPQTTISLSISRDGAVVFSGTVELAQMKRTPAELVGFVFRECSFPNGCFIMTGTGIVPSSDFTLQSKDKVDITIDNIGTLSNTVE